MAAEVGDGFERALETHLSGVAVLDSSISGDVSG
jgi:hypothetical protein